jgi:periplasmic protein CpxP/Spy
MRNTKVTNILLIILLIFNVAFIGKWWMGRRKMHHPKKEMQTETTSLMNDRSKAGMFLVKSLRFDTAQQKKLDTVLAAHYRFLDKYMGAYIRNQTKLFGALKDNPDSTTAFHCADSLSMLKVAMEKELYLHFLSIKNICNSGQLKQYNELIDNMSHEFVHHHDFSNTAKPNHDSL